MNRACDRGKGIICVGADHANRANDENQNHAQQYDILSDVLAAFVIPEVSGRGATFTFPFLAGVAITEVGDKLKIPWLGTCK